MILAAVNDLLFASKIRAAAGPLGADVTFVRSPAEIIEKSRASRPALVILDLNDRRLEPITTIATLKADAATRDLRIVGFVSHVDADTIKAARGAGADEVLARSAFNRNLGEILKAGIAAPGAHES